MGQSVGVGCGWLEFFLVGGLAVQNSVAAGGSTSEVCCRPSGVVPGILHRPLALEQVPVNPHPLDAARIICLGANPRIPGQGCHTARKNCAIAPGGTGTSILALPLVRVFVATGFQFNRFGELWMT